MGKNFSNLGNSKAVIIPAAMRKSLCFGDSYELVERPDGILVRPARPVRAGWREAAEALKAEGMTEEEKLWANDGNNDDLKDEWQW